MNPLTQPSSASTVAQGVILDPDGNPFELFEPARQ